MALAEENPIREENAFSNAAELSPPGEPPLPAEEERPDEREEFPPSLEELMALLHCSREELEGAVAALGVSDAHARQVLGSLAPSYLAIKGRFFSRKRGTAAGAFCLVADGRSGVVRDRIVWVGVQELPQTFSVDAGWEAVRSALLSTNVAPDRLLLRKIDQAIGPLTGPTELNVLFSFPEKLEIFASRFKEALTNVFHVDFVIEIRMERFQRSRFEGVFPPEAQKEEPAPQEVSEGGDDGHLQIYCVPVIDPVRGKPANLLQLGDLVEVDFDKVSGFGRYVGRLCARTGRVPVFPISRISLLPSGDYHVRLDIADDVSGVMKIAPSYRLRVHAPRRQPFFPFGRSDLRIFLEGAFLLAAMALVGLTMVYFLLK